MTFKAKSAESTATPLLK